MSPPWFRTIGWLSRPITGQGYEVAIIVALFCLQTVVPTVKS
jgi:hypothetical protein